VPQCENYTLPDQAVLCSTAKFGRQSPVWVTKRRFSAQVGGESFDDLVGEREQFRRHVETERLAGLEIANCRQRVVSGECHDLRSSKRQKGVIRNHERWCALPTQSRESRIDFVVATSLHNLKLQSELSGRRRHVGNVPERIAGRDTQIMLRACGLSPCGRIVFSTFRRCMSFHTAWVMSTGFVQGRLPICVRNALNSDRKFRLLALFDPLQSPVLRTHERVADLVGTLQTTRSIAPTLDEFVPALWREFAMW
jgi:hypothetical protein